MDFERELERVAEAYRGQGYNVTVRPGSDQLPPFAKDFRVEIVGYRGAGGVLVSAKKNRNELAADNNVQRYAEVSSSQPGWRFDLAILEAENPKFREIGSGREFSGEEINQSLDQAEQLTRTGFSRFALVAAWAGLEAAMRMRLRAAGEKAGWGSTPRQMARELYSAGLLSPNEFGRIESASQLRNQIVHGFSSPPSESEAVDADLVKLLGDVTRRLLSESQPEKQPA